MTQLLIFFGVLIFIIILGVAAAVLSREETNVASESTTELYPYTLKKYILTRAEYSFYKVLILHLPDHLSVFVKIRLGDLFDIESGLDKSTRARAWNKISSKHFDFVLIDKKACTVQSVIELDDNSHASKKAQTTDHFKDEACKAANLTLHRISVKTGYTADDIKHVTI